MPKQLLHYLGFRANAPQESGVSVPEGMPPESFFYSKFLRLGQYILPQNRLTPVRLPATATTARENPVVELAVALNFSPSDEGIDNEWMNGDWLL